MRSIFYSEAQKAQPQSESPRIGGFARVKMPLAQPIAARAAVPEFEIPGAASWLNRFDPSAWSPGKVEHPGIAGAIDYIQQHHREDLTLERVSSAVNLSTFYFCKKFRDVIGINFTDYVSRFRVQKAEALLLNPHLRVSEVAYQVGFQSITHFNRIFRKVNDVSPTKYRAAHVRLEVRMRFHP